MRFKKKEHSKLKPSRLQLEAYSIKINAKKPQPSNDMEPYLLDIKVSRSHRGSVYSTQIL